ncbi:hypothetical protein ACO0LM_00005 [Undibacterium sp. Di26W]|uniref:hypothetical protein n=1 Tax=Undibacterium sp. Di26W TaxID=3413035 RepID=UPI003BF022C4
MGILFIICLSKVTFILRHLWGTKFQGKLNVLKMVFPIEERIGKQLPKSYLHFLMVSQGVYKLSFAGPLPNSNFWPPDSVMTFYEEQNGDIEYWSDTDRRQGDKEYYQYGVMDDGCMKADPLDYVGSHISDLISVGYIDGDGFIALNPAEISSDGEWEAWYLDWRAVGVKRCRSFAELFQNIGYSAAEKPNKGFPYSAAMLQASCASHIQTVALIE